MIVRSDRMGKTLTQRLQTALAPWPEASHRLLATLEPASDERPQAIWPLLAAALTPGLPDDCQLATHRAVFEHWDPQHGPAPVWFPDEDALAASNAARLCVQQGYGGWAALHTASLADRHAFWSMMIQRLGIHFATPPASTLQEPADPYTPNWLPGAKMNIAESCFDLAKDTPAIRWGKADGAIEDWSCSKLADMTKRVASGLAGLGLNPGDAVAIDMPMTPESVAIYLGVIHAGMAAVSIADSFAPEQIATRLRISEAKLVITQDVIARKDKHLPLYAKVIDAGAARCVVVPSGRQLVVTLREADLSLEDFLGSNDANPYFADPAETINILFSSGTTGDPKAIPWSHTTPIKCAVDGHLHLDVRPGDVVCWPTNLGWMMGPWLIFAALINRATIALFDGAPSGEPFAKFVDQAKVSMLGLVPSMVKNWRSTDAVKDADWSGIRCFGSTGECSNPDDYFWLSGRAGYRPVIEYCGGTEIGGGYLTGSLLQPQSPSTFSTPAVGLDLVLIDDDGHPGDEGEVFIIPPSIGLSNQLLNRDHKAAYYDDCPTPPSGEPLRRHGDRLIRLPGGYYRAEGRADDTMNLGGIKVSSAEIERVVLQAGNISEAAAVAVPPEGGGPEQLVVFAVAKEAGQIDSDKTLNEMRGLIRSTLNPLFHLTRVVFVDALPRTASNKVMRRKLRDQLASH